MNSISIMPAPVATQISGAGSFFGSCQIASGNFEDMLNSMSANAENIIPDIMLNIKPDIMPELPAANSDSENLTEQPFDFQDFNKSEVLMQLQQILGEDAGTESYERIVNLLEKGTLSVQADTLDWDKDTFVKLTASLLERLDLAIKQIAKISGDVQNNYVQDSNAQEHENNFDIRKFLNLLTDLLKTGIITPQEYETVLKNPEESSLPVLLGELKKETGKLIEKLEGVEAEQDFETEQIAVPRQAEQPNQTEQPKLAEQPKPVKQGRQKKEFRQVEHSRQAKVVRQSEHLQSKLQPWQVEVHSQVKQFLQSEQLQSIKAEQSIQTELPMQAEQPKQAEQFRQTIEQPIPLELPRQAEQPKLVQAEQPRQEEYSKQTEQLEQPEQAKQTEPLLEELRVISMEMEIGIKPKDKVKFYELVNNLLDKGLINEQDLKNVMKIPAIDEESSSPIEPISKNEKNDAEKIEPASIRNNVLEKLWTSFESENKTEKENVFSKIKEIVELKSTSASSEKIGIKSTKVEVEVRAVWEAGDLKIETVNPKTGEKLQSVPVANMHRMQERINEFEVVRQVVSQARFITTPTGEQRMTMQLKPEHLGQVDLRITLNHGEMQIHARVESATAQAALESHVGLLRDGLEKQGINLERLEVSVDQRDRQDAFSLAERQEQQERHGKGRHRRGKETHLAISVKNDVNSDTGRRLGYNTMEYLA